MSEHRAHDGERAELEASRRAVAERGLVATASQHLTNEIAVHLPFETLGPFKSLLLQFFSRDAWTAVEAAELSRLVTPHVTSGDWEHRLDDDLTMRHGIIDGTYFLEVTGVTAESGSVFDRVFEGPVVPEATPHPRKVKFNLGGKPAPGQWYRRNEPTADERVQRLFAEPDVTDVMVAGDFVTIGIERASSWEERLEPLLALVRELFPAGEAGVDARTREELMREGGRLAQSGESLHLLDPDDSVDRARLEAALDDPDPRTRRVAVAILAESEDLPARDAAIAAGWADESLIVRRTAIDAAADLEDPQLRSVFEAALEAKDAWTRWKAVRALGDLGVGPSRDHIARLADDADFQVRFEVAAVLRDD